MKRRVQAVIATATLLAAGCVVKYNGKVHKFGTGDGENTDAKGQTGNATDPDSLAAELAGGTTPAGQTVTLKPDFAPNPTVIGTFSTKAEVKATGREHGARGCYGSVGEQATAVLRLTAPMKNTRISAPGASLILAEFGNKQFVCKESSYGNNGPSVMLDEWPAGDLTIFVGGRNGQVYNYDLIVEDEKRPIDITWKDKVKATELAEVPPETMVMTQMTATAAGRKSGKCGKSFFREVPDVVLSLGRPLGDMAIELRSAKPVSLEIVGPLTEDGRKLPTKCGSNDAVGYNRMEAGIYGIRVGTENSGEEVLYHLVIRSKTSTKNPTMPPSKFPDKIALEESVVTWHYPQLGTRDIETSEPNRESVFLSAPKELFVFPKFDMDSSVADAIGVSKSRGKDKKAAAAEYPKENEPLLLLNKNGQHGEVMAIDGSIFRVNMKDIQADPGGAVVFPSAPRNTDLSFDQALKSAGPEDARAIKTWENAEKAVDRCADQIRRSYEGTFESACRGLEKAADNQKAALAKTLEKSRVKRRTASMSKIKTRVEALFK